jgi:hypothetical protein
MAPPFSRLRPTTSPLTVGRSRSSMFGHMLAAGIGGIGIVIIVIIVIIVVVLLARR